MPKELKVLGLALGIGLAWSVAAAAAGLDDDLAVVRKAVARGPERPASPRGAEPQAPPVSARPVWLKLRLVEGHEAQPSLSLKLLLPRGTSRGTQRAESVLEALRSRELLRIEADEATLRVWVE